GGGGGVCCAICLDDLVKGQWATQLPCGHRFHSQCALRWLNICGECPLCKISI
ncbi:unnamed protein product, partial [Heterosigma akashiwo]